MIPATQIKTLFVRFHKREFLCKIVNLKIGDCSESTNTPSIISAPSVNTVTMTVWVWAYKYLVQKGGESLPRNAL